MTLKYALPVLLQAKTKCFLPNVEFLYLNNITINDLI